MLIYARGQNLMLSLARDFACSSCTRSAREKTCSLHPYFKVQITSKLSIIKMILWLKIALLLDTTHMWI